MKKVLIVLVLILSVLAVNAQTTQTTVTKEKTVRTVVLAADLQKSITDNIAKDFIGYTIKEATSVTTDGIVTYEVIILKEATTQTLVYDKDGVFVKMIPVTPKPL
jgi:hypothetical protein